jgi:DHA1 family bicyclomycin/chloramphenicol resistance-like MFS transporter
MAKTLGWRFNFYLLGVLETILLMAIYFYLPETLKKTKKFSISASYQSTKEILKDSTFFKPVLLLALVNSSYMVFITHASFLYIKDLGTSEIGFAFHQGAIVLVYCLGLLAYSQLTHYYSITSLLNSSMIGYLFYGVLTLFFVFNLIDLSPLKVTLWVFISSLVSGPILTSCSSLALEHSSHSLGTQSALIEFMMGSIGAAFMLISSALNAQDAGCLYIVIAITVAASFIVWRNYSPQNHPTNPYQSVAVNE